MLDEHSYSQEVKIISCSKFPKPKPFFRVMKTSNTNADVKHTANIEYVIFYTFENINYFVS